MADVAPHGAASGALRRTVSARSGHVVAGGDVVVAEEIELAYRDFTLGPISASFARGVTCVVGANGAGKSTFFRVLAGLESRHGGRVRLGTRAPDRVGLLPQEMTFPARATCEEYLTHVAWLFAVRRADRARAVSDALSAVGLSARAGSRIATLSGGMRRRLGLAHVLVNAPQLVLLDEPTVGLDPLQRIAIRETIASLAADRTVVVSTHLVEDVAALADDVLVLRNGRPAFTGSVHELAAPHTDEAGSASLERAIATLLAEDDPTEAVG